MTGKFQVHGVWLKLFLQKIPFPLGIFPAYLLYKQKRKKWKKGFLVIAKEAGVPVYLGRIDYKDKYCTWGPRFEPTGDPDADLKYIMSTYKDVNPRHPENFSAGD